MKKISEQECFTEAKLIRVAEGGGRKKLWLKFHWYCSLICSSGYVHLKVVIFCNAKKVSKFVFYLLLNVLEPVWIGLTSHVKVSISQLKTSRYLGLTKKNAGPTFALNLTFTIHHPQLNCHLIYYFEAFLHKLKTDLHNAYILLSFTHHHLHLGPLSLRFDKILTLISWPAHLPPHWN